MRKILLTAMVCMMVSGCVVEHDRSRYAEPPHDQRWYRDHDNRRYDQDDRRRYDDNDRDHDRGRNDRDDRDDRDNWHR